MSDPQQLREKIAEQVYLGHPIQQMWNGDNYEWFEIRSTKDAKRYYKVADALLPLVLGEKREAFNEGWLVGVEAASAVTRQDYAALAVRVSNPYLPAGDHTENENEGDKN